MCDGLPAEYDYTADIRAAPTTASQQGRRSEIYSFQSTFEAISASGGHKVGTRREHKFRRAVHGRAVEVVKEGLLN